MSYQYSRMGDYEQARGQVSKLDAKFFINSYKSLKDRVEALEKLTEGVIDTNLSAEQTTVKLTEEEAKQFEQLKKSHIQNKENDTREESHMSKNDKSIQKKDMDQAYLEYMNNTIDYISSHIGFGGVPKRRKDR